MKNYLFLSLFFLVQIAFAQSTLIKPGIVLPQMTTAQRTTIASPSNGMLVFDTNTQSYWYRQSGAWVELPKGGSTNNYWQLNGTAGNEITNTNSGGFWSKNATALTNNSNDTSNPPTAPTSGAGTRLMWIPSRSAFRVGTARSDEWDATNIGLFSFASGYNTSASKGSSTAMGFATTASGQASTAMGLITTSSGGASTTMGSWTTASGDVSTAMGYNTTAPGFVSTAMGYITTASGDVSTAMGYLANTNNMYASFAIGGANTASRATNDKAYQMKMHFNEYKLLTGANNDVTITDGQVTTSNSLAVFGTNSKAISGYGFLNSVTPTGLYTVSNGNTTPYSIYSASRILAQEFDAYSDIRHKKLHSFSNGSTDLALLNQLKVSNYTFIDTVAKGGKMQLGFIAQQVEQIVPEAINKIQDYIPSVYDMAKCLVFDETAHTMTITTNKPHDFQANDEIKLISLDKEHKVKVVSIVDTNTFVVNNWEKTVNKLFVFGKQVNDFRTVDYNRLFTLGISAIQELSKQNDALKATVEKLISRLNSIEANKNLTGK